MKNYTYEEIQEKINHASTFGSLPGVEISRILLEKLGHPEKDIPFVHVAGTNGKGSVCAFLSSILIAGGWKVGTFTSPHLIDFEERITVKGVQIPKADVARLGNEVLDLPLDIQPTMFDYCMAIALLYFKEQQCDVLVMETGLGGRLDSTNAIGVPAVSVITKIGYDHVAILGNTLAKIAAEKAGIIKNGSYLVMEQQEQEALEVLVAAAEENCPKAYAIVSDADIAWAKSQKLKLLGTHQWENAAAAALAAEHLIRQLCPDMEDVARKKLIESGLSHATWQGRMELLSEKPFFMVDGAHNSNGVTALLNSLKYLYPGEKFHFVMGVMADKDYEEMVRLLVPVAGSFWTVTPENHRALQGQKLARFISTFGIPTKNYERIQDVVNEILHDTSCSEKIVAFGSLYFIGELKNIWNTVRL